MSITPPAPIGPEKLFVGQIRPDESRMLYRLLKGARSAGYETFVEPCAGAFPVSMLAAQVGWPRWLIGASDITLFSAVYAYGINGRDVGELDIRIDLDGYDHLDLTDPATVLYAQALLRAENNAGVRYWTELAEHYRRQESKIIANLRTQIDAAQEKLGGFRFEILDFWKHLNRVKDIPKAVVVLLSPNVRGGYKSFYRADEYIQWKQPEGTFDDPVKLYRELDEWQKDCPALILSGRDNRKGYVPPADSVVLLRGSAERKPSDNASSRSGYTYLVSNRPDEVEQLVGSKVVMGWRGFPVEKGDFRPLPEGYEITDTSEIAVQPLLSKTAMYYRLLWTRYYRGQPCALNFGLFLDGYLVGVFGYGSQTSDPRSRHKPQEFFGAHLLYTIPVPRRGRGKKRWLRLLYRIGFSRATLKLAFRSFELHKIREIESVQLSPHPNLSALRGLMKLRKREKHRLQGFKLHYIAPVSEDTWDETLKVFLRDEVRYEKNRDREAVKRKAAPSLPARESADERAARLERRKKKNRWDRERYARDADFRKADSERKKRRQPGRNVAKKVKMALYTRQKGRCAICHQLIPLKGNHVDHRKPLNQGGTDTPDNFQVVCSPCNNAKGDKVVNA